MKWKETRNWRKKAAKKKKWEMVFQNRPVPLINASNERNSFCIFEKQKGQMSPMSSDALQKKKYSGKKMPVTAHSSNDHPPNVRKREARNNGNILSYSLHWWNQAARLLSSRQGHSPRSVHGAPGAVRTACRRERCWNSRPEKRNKSHISRSVLP